MPSTAKLVVPVKFSGGGLSLQTTTSRIGAEGMFVRSMLSPKEGSVLELTLSLPGSALPLQARGVVAPAGEPSTERGFWVRFEKLSDDVRVCLDVLLRGKGVAGPGRPARQEQTVHAGQPRAYPRVPARLRVGWTSSRDFLSAYSDNISRGGIFIATDAPPELRDIVELSVELPDGLPPVKTRGEVVRRVTVAEARRSGGVAGAGLQFLDASDDFRQRLDACIEELSD
jgi:uncharacterized protein (TIGR02266 family)